MCVRVISVVRERERKGGREEGRRRETDREVHNHNTHTTLSQLMRMHVQLRVENVQSWFKGEKEDEEVILPRNPYGGYGSTSDHL